MNRLQLLLAGTAIAILAAARPAIAAEAASAPAAVADIVRSATDLPGPLAHRGPATVRIDLETVEITGQLDDGSTYQYWTFNRRVPGPFVRVRIGDTVEVTMKNAANSTMAHNVDFHAVTGPGGGAVATVADPGETKGFTFKARNPGLFVYHCATPMVARHIANGMYGLILVEPEGGLSKVDHEFYVMQGEIYTEQAYGTPGLLTEGIEKLFAEQPEYYVFNGAADALVKQPLKAKTGETVRIFFGVGGPNKTSSFHVIGEVFDRAYPLASLTSPPMTNIQTMTVPPGGAAVAEFKVEVPGRYLLVDHALSRMDRGLKGLLVVEGAARPDIFRPHQKDAGDGHSGH